MSSGSGRTSERVSSRCFWGVQLKLTQEEFALKAGVALTAIRKIEQGKENLSLSKVNQVLKMFGHVLGPVNEK